MTKFHCTFKGCSHDFEADVRPERCPKCNERGWCWDICAEMLENTKAHFMLAIGQAEIRDGQFVVTR